MWSLLFVPLVLTNAQPDLAGASSWLLNGLNAVSTSPTRAGGSTNQGQGTSNTTPFKINITNKPNLLCTTTDGEDGKCVKPQYCSKPLPEKDPTTNFIYRETACSYLLQCCALKDLKPTARKTNTLPVGCGWSNPGGYSLRTTDSDTTGFSDYAEFPWMVALLKRSYGKKWSPQDYLGGGTLIHPSVVLTVAHKVSSSSPSELKCRAGEWDFKIEDEIYLHQDRNVRKISIHENFLHLRAHYDAALLFLEMPFKLKDVYHIGVACLARDMPAPGTLCYSMGWGSTFNDPSNTSLLKKIRLPIVSSNTCERQLRRTPLGPKYALHESLCCAGGEQGSDTCIGDGGSSLVCPVKGDKYKRYAVYGMVAYGVGCGKQDVPGVYAKISVMTDWINREMQGEQLGTSSYYV